MPKDASRGSDEDQAVVTSPDRILARLRTFCLSLPGVTEVEAWGHPNFRAGKKTFAVFEHYRGRPSIAFKAEDGMQELLIDEVRFFRTPYLGNRGWVSVWVDGDPDWKLVKDLVRRSHRLMLPAGATKRAARRPPRRRPKSGRGSKPGRSRRPGGRRAARS
jgi:predicted DNA-binding protein (MmcQ/YjbR family)